MLRNWRFKGLVQKVLSTLPGGLAINDRLQTSVGDLKNFDHNVGTKVDDWAGIVSYLEAVGRNDCENRTCLEIGSGWYPTLPFCFVLAGVRKIHTVDLTRHMNGPLTFRMLRALEPHLERIAKASIRPLPAVRKTFERLTAATDLPQLLSVANVEYHAPQDATSMPWLPSGSVDLVFSNSVMEHVYAPVIPKLMRESWRILDANGLMVHAVACNDHYAHFDRSISFVNFLQFTESQWRLWNNDVNYQNRLRAPEFIRFAKECGFQILHEKRAIRAGTREALAKMKVAPEFAQYSPDDLAATTVDFVAAKTAR